MPLAHPGPTGLAFSGCAACPVRPFRRARPTWSVLKPPLQSPYGPLRGTGYQRSPSSAVSDASVRLRRLCAPAEQHPASIDAPSPSSASSSGFLSPPPRPPASNNWLVVLGDGFIGGIGLSAYRLHLPVSTLDGGSHRHVTASPSAGTFGGGALIALPVQLLEHFGTRTTYGIAATLLVHGAPTSGVHGPRRACQCGWTA